MSKAYNRKDRLYQKAKLDGYRSRAAYKLFELQDKSQVIKNKSRVLDLGCYPGGWLQVASEISGPEGLIIGVDLKELEPFPKHNPNNKHAIIYSLQEDLFEETKIVEELKLLNNELFDVIISDMSPPLTGIKDKDQAGTIAVFKLALRYCELLLKPQKGNFLCKVFPSQELEEIFKKEKKNWSSLQKTVLKSSRNSSNELYVIGKGYTKAK